MSNESWNVSLPGWLPEWLADAIACFIIWGCVYPAVVFLKLLSNDTRPTEVSIHKSINRNNRGE